MDSGRNSGRHIYSHGNHYRAMGSARSRSQKITQMSETRITIGLSLQRMAVLSPLPHHHYRTHCRKNNPIPVQARTLALNSPTLAMDGNQLRFHRWNRKPVKNWRPQTNTHDNKFSMKPASNSSNPVWAYLQTRPSIPTLNKIQNNPS